MTFQFPINRIKTTKISSKSNRKLLSSGDTRGRHAITVYAQDADAYIGDETVTATTGIAIPQGSSMTFPLMMGKEVSMYVSGATVTLAEYY